MEINTEAVASRNVVTVGVRGIVAECATPIDATRIAACINACRGVSTHALGVGLRPMSQVTQAVTSALAKIDDARAVLKGLGA